jgi:uncharacterized membrane protein YcaP (DUF421 family)
VAPPTWDSIFSLPIPVSEKVVRAVLIYAFLVVAFRLNGKRELGQWNSLDLAVLLLVANAVQNGIIGTDDSVTGAVIGGATLFGVNVLLSRATYLFPWLQSAVEGTPTVLIQDGKPLARAMRRENISLPQLLSIARRQGFDDLGQVRTAILETNGTVTMFRHDEPRRYHPDMPDVAPAG